MAEEITVGGITVPLSHPDKVLFPDDGITKRDLARYYADVAGLMLPWLRDRPITMVRYPDGLAGQRFFQKNAPAYFPDWIRRVEVAKEAAPWSTPSATSPPPWCTWPTRPASRFMRSPAARTSSTYPIRWCSTSIRRPTSGSRTSGVPRCGRATCWTMTSACPASSAPAVVADCTSTCR